jgi:hypothetical protein
MFNNHIVYKKTKLTIYLFVDIAFFGVYLRSRKIPYGCQVCGFRKDISDLLLHDKVLNFLRRSYERTACEPVTAVMLSVSGNQQKLIIMAVFIIKLS